MWSREQLKHLAKQELKISYWQSFGVTILAGIIAGGVSIFSLFINVFQMSGVAMAPMLSMMLLIFLGLALAYTAFVVGPIEVGMASYFVRAPYGNRDFNNLFSAFKGPNYMQVVKTMFMKNLFIGLWSMLFIIPGIIKIYEYRMVAYIISDDPRLSYKDALNISKAMTYGHKADMFVLDLSFVGWYVLGYLACGLGLLFVEPYTQATYAQLYFILRYNYQLQSQQQQQAQNPQV